MTVAVRWTSLLGDYITFHRLALQTGDVDPVYPVLAKLAHTTGMSPGDAAWLGLLHVAYYDLGSALVAYLESAASGAVTAPMLTLPCGTERRGHRNPQQLRAHLEAITARAHAHGDAAAWLAFLAAGAAGDLTYRRLADGLQTVYGYGRWATYKACELLSHVLRPYDPAWAAVEPDDMGHAHSSGPRQGLALIAAPVPTGNSRSDVAALDAISTRLVNDLHAAGAAATVATAETTLCDFHALTAGRYYVGHDIDQMAHQLWRAERHEPAAALLHAAWRARSAVLPAAYLGEHDDRARYGVDRARRNVYRTSGVIVER